jgi:hypothetical protein
VRRPRTVELRALLAGGAAAAVSLAAALLVPSHSVGVALAAAVLALMCVWMLATTKYELTLAVMMLYVGLADGYIRLKTGAESLTLVRDLMLYSIVAGALVRQAVRGETFGRPPLVGWIVAFVAVVLVQLLNPGNGSWSHSFESLRPHLEWVPLFFFGYAILRTPKRIRVFLALLLLIAAANGVVGYLQFNLTPEQLAAWGPGYSERILGDSEVAGRYFIDTTGTHRVRPFGLGSDTGSGGMVALLTAPAALALLAARRRVAAAAAVVPLAIGVVTAIVTSQARVVVVGSLLAVLVFGVLTTSSRRLGALLTAFTCAAVVSVGAISVIAGGSSEHLFERYADITPGRVFETTYDYRGSTLALVPEYARDFPLGAGLGIGGPAGSFRDPGQRSDLSSESEFTYLLIELGIPGLLALLGLNARLLSLSIRRVRRIEDHELKLLLAALAAPLFALFATWLIGPTTSSPPASPYFWFVAGALAYWLAREPGGAAPAMRPPA